MNILAINPKMKNNKGVKKKIQATAYWFQLVLE